jgi:hypothetical protein
MNNTPSKNTRDYWIYAERKTGEYPGHTVRGGKWLIFISNHNVDRIWVKIGKAVEEGELGGTAKVATAKVNLDFPGSKTKVICVYTYDWRDKEDVKKIREELRKLGITRKIAYKTDKDTELGKYRINTDEKLSRYYE